MAFLSGLAGRITMHPWLVLRTIGPGFNWVKKSNIVAEDDTPGYIVKDGEMLFFYYIFIPGLVVHIRKIFAKPVYPPH